MVTLISPPPPKLCVSACSSVSCTRGGGFRPRPFATERYSANAFDLTPNAPFWRVSRFGGRVRHPSVAGEWVLIVARCPAGRICIVTIAGGPRGHERLLLGRPDPTAVGCPSTSSGENAGTRVSVQNDVRGAKALRSSGCESRPASTHAGVPVPGLDSANDARQPVMLWRAGPETGCARVYETRRSGT